MKPLKFAWGIWMLSLCLSLVSIFMLPADMQIPVHWNAAGESDDHASLLVALLTQPLIMLLIIGVFIGIGFIEPRQANMKESRAAKEWMALATVSLLAVINLGLNAYAHGYQWSMGKLILGAVMVLCIIVGNFLSKTRSNFFIGIRTPWTLSSEEVWRKTHRLAGRLFMVVGLIGLVAVVSLDMQYAIYLNISMVIATALISCIYSWVKWRGIEHKS
ncbi:SdpI family protein [Thalassotalea ganghwensis]